MPIWLSALPASNDKLRFSLVFLVVLVLLAVLAVLVFLGLLVALVSLVLLELLAILALLVARKLQFYLAFFYIFHLGCSVFC